MAKASISLLPSELIVQIAIYCDATAVLNLSMTCQYLQYSCRNSLIFKEIILRSQNDNWPQSALDLGTLQLQCGDQVSSWARFAVADQRAHELSNVQEDAVDLPSTLQWSQALLTVKHPFILHPCWTKFEHIVESPSTSQSWCAAAAILASDYTSTHFGTNITTLQNITTSEDDTIHNYLQGFCWTVLDIRARMNGGRLNRLNSASASRVDLPGLSDLDLRCGRSYQGLPLPFPRDAKNWESWSIESTQSLLDHLTSGFWQGYYVHHQYYPGHNDTLDPAMKGIKFSRFNLDDADNASLIPVIAEGCRDGVGEFKIQGIFSRLTPGEVSFTGYKGYYAGGDRTRIDLQWDWSLKLTSFGLIGYWGTVSNGKIQRDGTVWLWKNKR